MTLHEMEKIVRREIGFTAFNAMDLVTNPDGAPRYYVLIHRDDDGGWAKIRLAPDEAKPARVETSPQGASVVVTDGLLRAAARIRRRTSNEKANGSTARTA